MTHDVSHVGDYHFTTNDALFLDANIWLCMYGSTSVGRNNRKETYLSAFRRILEAKSRIYINVLVVSEIINVWARISYRDWEYWSPQNFKAYRSSDAFKSVASDIAADIKRILSYCSRIESGFETAEIDTLIDEYKETGSDFNDQIIRELCKSRDLRLITDDGDFYG